MSTPITIHYTENDIVAADRLYTWSYFRDPKSWLKILLVWIVAQLVLFAIYAVYGENDASVLDLVKVAEVALLIGLFVVPFLLSRWLGPRQARRHFRAMKILHDPIELSWASDGLKEITPTSNVLTPWDHFPKWREDEQTFLIFITQNLYRCVPKRFMTADQIGDLRARLTQSVGAR